MGLIPWVSKEACDADYFWPKVVIWDSLDCTLFGRVQSTLKFYYHTSASTFVLSIFFLLRLRWMLLLLLQLLIFGRQCWSIQDFPLLLGHPWEPRRRQHRRCYLALHAPKMHVSDAKIRGCCRRVRALFSPLKCSPPEDNERRASSFSIFSQYYLRRPTHGCATVQWVLR